MPDARSQTRFGRWFILLCVLAVGVTLARYLKHGVDGWRVPSNFDDAYFFVRYAQHTLEGHGHAWNAGEAQIYGSTSLLHFFLVLLATATLPWAAISIPSICSWSMGLTSIAALTWVSGRLSKHSLLHRNYLLFGTLYTTAFANHTHFLFHATTGMETMLAVFCNTTLILATMAMVQRTSAGRIALAVLAGYASILARPDSGLYAVMFPMLALLLLGRDSSRRSALAKFLVALTAVLLVDAWVKWRVLGTPFPLAFYVKSPGFYDVYLGHHLWDPFLQLQRFSTSVTPFLALVIFFWRPASWRLTMAFLAPLAATYAYHFTALQVMGSYGRFYFPGAPFILILAVLVLDSALRRSGEVIAFRPRELCVRTFAVLALVFLSRTFANAGSGAYLALMEPDYELDTDRYYQVASERSLPDIGWWETILAVSEIAEMAPRETRIALTEHGYIGAVSPDLTLIDMSGLHNVQMVVDGFSAQAILTREPDLIWMPHYHYPTLVEEFLASDAFWDDYTLYAEAYNYGLAIRTGSVHRERLEQIVAENWAKHYEGYELADFRALRR